jgi:predicted  nucleic acid-binding Zn-ribbon protein
MKDKAFWVEHLKLAQEVHRLLVEKREELAPLLEHYQSQRKSVAWKREKMLILERQNSRIKRKIQAWSKRILYYQERITALGEVTRFQRILKFPVI